MFKAAMKKLYSTILVFLLMAGYCYGVASMGMDAILTSKYTINNYKIGEGAVPPCEGTADSIYVYVKVIDSLAMRTALYLCAGADTLIIDSSIEQQLSAGTSWRAFPLLLHPTLYPTDSYFVTIWGSGGGANDTVYYVTSGGIGIADQSSTYSGNGWSADWTGATKTSSREITVYCIFTPAVSSPNNIFGAARHAKSASTLADCYSGGLFIPLYSGNIDSIRAEVAITLMACSLRAALYVCAGADTLWRDSCAHKYLATGINWTTFSFLAGTSISEDSTYVLLLSSESNGIRYLRSFAGTCREPTSASNCPLVNKSLTFTTAWPNDLTGHTVTNNQEASIFAYYHTTVVSGLPNYLHGPAGAGVRHSVSGSSVLHGP